MRVERVKKVKFKIAVRKKLIKWGNNVDDVEEMINRHFDDTYNHLFSKPHSSTKNEAVEKIASFIRTIY